ncbi:MAG TPA: hypothetical protein VHF22_03345 [Planctomycetota bacterium]|nr:hypothetical protein [Planctomycetota bacterium]
MADEDAERKAEEGVKRISSELAKLEEGHLKAYRDKDRVIFVIQDAPEELRRLADALERINVREIQALIAFKDPPRADK